MQNNKPIYLQIADQIADNIMSGRLVAEQRVPSVREQAAESQVNVNTIARTYEILERDGVIFNRRGLGYFVSLNAIDIIAERRRKAFYEGGEMNYIFNRLSSVGLTPKNLYELYSNFLENKQ